jgi:negative regulator of replication initiation
VPPPPPSGGASTGESALDVAMRVNKLKKTHQAGGAAVNKKEVEQEAWQALNSMTEEQINNAEGKAVSLLLNSWAYFAKFWARGKDGPV